MEPVRDARTGDLIVPSRFYPDYAGDLHPEAESLLEALASGKAPDLSDPVLARKEFLPDTWLEAPHADVAIRDTVAAGVPIRLFSPRDEGFRPMIAFFHGGGFVVGRLEEFDGFCARLSHQTGCLVVAVDYRLAPEHPFPAALEDAWNATRWMAEYAGDLGGDPTRLALMGDSAGGNLVAQVARMALEQGGPSISHQVLLCPWVDLRDDAEEAEAFRSFGSGPWLSAKSLRWFRDHYLGPGMDPQDARISPLLAPAFHGLPPATVVTAEFDILRDQGTAHAERLRAAGVPVIHREVPGMLHDFTVLPRLFSPAREVLDEIADRLARAFRTVPEI